MLDGCGEVSNDFCLDLLEAVWSASDGVDHQCGQECTNGRTFAAGGKIDCHDSPLPHHNSSCQEATTAPRLPADGQKTPFLSAVVVEGMGELPLPLTAQDAIKLRAVCEQAPYGHGMATVVDTSVRRAWQLDAKKISFPMNTDLRGGNQGHDPTTKGQEQSKEMQTNSFLSGSVQQLALRAVAAMGLDGSALQVEARLYKLLLYESDGHFKAHRDTEKEEGMFGTLVIQLPTETGYEGGALVVRHRGVNKTFDFSSSGQKDYFFTAFFADCEHELQRVTRGYRLCLVFNLVRQNKEIAINPGDLRGLSEAVARTELLLRPWCKAIQAEDLGASTKDESGFKEEDRTRKQPAAEASEENGERENGGKALADGGSLGEEKEEEGDEEEEDEEEELYFPEKLAIPLRHKYTKKNLSFAGLKGEDRVLAEVLRSCRDQTGQPWLDLHLCIVTKQVYGMPDGYDHYEDYRGRRGIWNRWGSYSYSDDDEEEDEDDDESERRRELEEENGRRSLSGYDMLEIHDTEFDNGCWVGLDDKDLGFVVPIDLDKEIVYDREEDSEPFDIDAGPDEDEVEGYTGNAGPTLTYWYHTALLVIWPRCRRIEIACDANFEGALSLVEKLESHKQNAEARVALRKVLAFMERGRNRKDRREGAPWGKHHTPIYMRLLQGNRNKVSVGAARLLRLAVQLEMLLEALQVLKMLGALAQQTPTAPAQSFSYSRSNDYAVSTTEADAVALVVRKFGWKVCSQLVLSLLVPQRFTSDGSSYAHLARRLQSLGEIEAAEAVGKRTLFLFFSSKSASSRGALCAIIHMMLSLPTCLQEYSERLKSSLRGLNSSTLAEIILHLHKARFPSRGDGSDNSASLLLPAPSCSQVPGGSPESACSPCGPEQQAKAISVKDEPLMLEVFTAACRMLTGKELQSSRQLSASQPSYSHSYSFYSTSSKAPPPLPIIPLLETFLWLGNADIFSSMCEAVRQQYRQSGNKTLLEKLYNASVLFDQVSKPENIAFMAPFRSLLSERIDELRRRSRPAFSWCQPAALVPGHPQLEAFLRGPGESFTYHVAHGGLPGARKLASNFVGRVKDGHSATALPGGRGKDAYVTVKKTKAVFQALVQNWEREQSELKELLAKRLTLGPFPEKEEEDDAKHQEQQQIAPAAQKIQLADLNATGAGNQVKKIKAEDPPKGEEGKICMAGPLSAISYARRSVSTVPAAQQPQHGVRAEKNQIPGSLPHNSLKAAVKSVSKESAELPRAPEDGGRTVQSTSSLPAAVSSSSSATHLKQREVEQEQSPPTKKQRSEAPRGPPMVVDLTLDD